MMDPKPTRRKKRKQGRVKSGAGILHMQKVRGLCCVACGRWGPSDCHHVFHDRYSGKKASDFATIPLCKTCHQVGPEAIHVNKKLWLEDLGPDWSYILETLQAIYGAEYSINH